MAMRDFERNVDTRMMPSAEELTTCPSVKGWEEDAFAEWVADHRNEVRNTICNMTAYRDGANCGFD